MTYESPTWHTLTVAGLTFEVSSDYIKDAEGVRVAVIPAEAQRIADANDAILPTRWMVDYIHNRADVKLPFHGLRRELKPGESMSSRRMIELSNAKIEHDLGGRTGLIAGHKKDIVIGRALGAHPRAVVIYGGWTSEGLVQPYSAVHKGYYFDYSHGVRLVKRAAHMNGSPVDLVAMLLSEDAHWISDEGVLNRSAVRYPT